MHGRTVSCHAAAAYICVLQQQQHRFPRARHASTQVLFLSIIYLITHEIIQCHLDVCKGRSPLGGAAVNTVLEFGQRPDPATPWGPESRVSPHRHWQTILLGQRRTATDSCAMATASQRRCPPRHRVRTMDIVTAPTPRTVHALPRRHPSQKLYTICFDSRFTIAQDSSAACAAAAAGSSTSSSSKMAEEQELDLSNVGMEEETRPLAAKSAAV